MREAKNLLSIVEGVSTRLLRIEALAVVGLFPILVALTFAQVIFRYVLSYPLPWTEELAINIMIWLTFIGAAMAMADKEHFGLELIKMRLRHKPLALIETVSYLFSFLFLLIVIIYGLEVAFDTYHTLTTLPVSKRWFFAAIPTGGILMLLHLVIHIARTFLPASGDEIG